MQAQSSAVKIALGRGLLAIFLAVIAYYATDALGEASPDRTDEAEWTAISIVHDRQLGGGPPPGIELDRQNERLQEDPWRQGVQATTFGWPNPGFHKWLWGKANRELAPESIDPFLFFRYNRGDLRRASQAIVPLTPAIERARLVVAMASALCAVLLFFIARRLSGWLGGAVAMALWLFHPLVRLWSHQARPDFGMVALLLATILVILHASKAIRGEQGILARVAAWIALGGFAGLCVATKLNGALAAICVALCLPLMCTRREAGFAWKSMLLAAPICGLLIVGLLWANFPYLWNSPTEHLADVLAFWDKHMKFQQDRWEGTGGVVARGFGDQLSLMSSRLSGAEDPIGAQLGWSGYGIWILLGLGALLHSARRGPAAHPTRLLLVCALVVLLGTSWWLPLDWDRYFFAPVALLVVIEASLVGLLVEALRRRWRASREASSAAVADTGQ